MAEYIQVNLQNMISEIKEERTKKILSSFKCDKNKDVESFLKTKAIEFSKQSISKTHIVFHHDGEGEYELVGYFTLANKVITIADVSLSKNSRKRIIKFARHSGDCKVYDLPIILIGQIGKNYNEGRNLLISGKDLMQMAFEKVTSVQTEVGGKFVYLECEDNTKLISFYTNLGFAEFGKRALDGDETGLKGKYLVQLIKYMSEK